MNGRLLLPLLLLPGSVRAQPNLVTAAATPDRTTIRLSEHLRVTLAIEGPAPLRVELPEPLLAAGSASAWRVRPAGSGPAGHVAASGGASSSAAG